LPKFLTVEHNPIFRASPILGKFDHIGH
jgi:hypothetical protein